MSLKEKLQEESHQKSEEEKRNKVKSNRKRIAMISAATVGGAALAALTAGLSGKNINKLFFNFWNDKR